MLETSRDLLNVLIGLSVLMVAVFFSALLYQMIRGIKNINDTTAKFKNIADTIHQGLTDLKSHSSATAAYVGLFIKGGLEILKQLQNRKANKNKERSNKK